MRKKKDGLTVAEAKQQLKDSASAIRSKNLLAENFWPVAMGCFVAGMLSADSVKTRESIVSLAVSVLKKIV